MVLFHIHPCVCIFVCASRYLVTLLSCRVVRAACASLWHRPPWIACPVWPGGAPGCHTAPQGVGGGGSAMPRHGLPSTHRERRGREGGAVRGGVCGAMPLLNRVKVGECSCAAVDHGTPQTTYHTNQPTGSIWDGKVSFCRPLGPRYKGGGYEISKCCAVPCHGGGDMKCPIGCCAVPWHVPVGM